MNNENQERIYPPGRYKLWVHSRGRDKEESVMIPSDIGVGFTDEEWETMSDEDRRQAVNSELIDFVMNHVSLGVEPES